MTQYSHTYFLEIRKRQRNVVFGTLECVNLRNIEFKHFFSFASLELKIK